MSPTFLNLSLQRFARLFDLGVLSLVFLIAFAISSRSFTWPSLAEVLLVRIKVVNIVLFGSYLAVCAAIFSLCGLYLSHRLSHWTRQVREILVATTLITGVIFLVPLRMRFATIEFLIIFWVLSFSGLVLTRIVGQHLLYYVRSRGKNLRRIVIVGEGRDAATLADRIEKESALGYRVVGIIDAIDAKEIRK